MKDEPETDEGFRQRFGSLLESLRSRMGPCPPPDELISFNAGRLSPETTESVRAHVTLCGECRTLLNHLAMELEGSLREAALSEWSSLRRQLTTELDRFLQAQRKPKERTLRGLTLSHLSHFKLTYAAALAVLLLSSLVWYKLSILQKEASQREHQILRGRTESEELHRRIRELSEQSRQATGAGHIYGNPFSYHLAVPSGPASEMGGADKRPTPPAVDVIRIPTRAQVLNLVLHMSAGPADRYYVEMRDGAGALELEGQDLTRDEQFNIALTILKTSLQPKEYVLKIFEIRDGSSRLRAERRLRIIL